MALRRTHDTQQYSRSYIIPYLFVFAVLMLAGLHGTSILKVFTIVSLNYAIAKYTKGSKLNPLLTWIFNGIILFANEQNEGYRYAVLHPSLEILACPSLDLAQSDTKLCYTQDSVQGIYPRWHVSFNITMLRLVSFNMDYYWACNKAGPSDVSGVTSHEFTLGLTTSSQVARSLISNGPPCGTRLRRTPTRITSHTCSTRRYTSQVPS